MHSTANGPSIFLPLFSLFLVFSPPVKCCARQSRVCCQMTEYPIDKYVEQLGDLPSMSMHHVSLNGLDGSAQGSLSCSFEDGESCAWGNLPGNRLRWKRVRFKEPLPTRNQMKSVTSKSELPDGTFAVVGKETASGGEEVTSVLVATVHCQNGAGKLKFNHWTNSASNELHVCVAPLKTPKDKNCVASVRRTSPNPMHFTIPAPSDHGPFQIRLEAQGFQAPGFIMIDDIVYEADLCGRQQRKPSRPSHAKPPAINPRQGTCAELLSCDFEQGTSCFYDVKGSRNGQWNIGSGRTGNRLIGVQADGSGNPQGYYAFVGHDYPGTDGGRVAADGAVYILQSPEVNIRRQMRLHYDVFLRSAGPVVKVCINNFSTCPKTHSLKSGRSSNDGWTRRESITLKPNVKRVLFVVKKLQPNQYVALDNLSVEDGHDAC